MACPRLYREGNLDSSAGVLMGAVTPLTMTESCVREITVPSNQEAAVLRTRGSYVTKLLQRRLSSLFSETAPTGKGCCEKGVRPSA